MTPRPFTVRRWARATAGLLGVLLALVIPGPAAADPASGSGPAEAASERAVAVAAPNLRLGVAYDYGHVDSTRTLAVGPSTVQTLSLGAEGGHAVRGQLIGTLPLVGVLGLRAIARGGLLEARRSLDALSPGASTIDAYGAQAELFLRSPRIGSFAVGGGYDRLSGDGGVTADQLTGSADVQIFFPDLGSGPLDWFTRFEFRHREISGSGQPFNIDADVYHVTGGARWYATPDVAVVFSGEWQRTEEEFFAEDDSTGGIALHWRLPLGIGPVSVEIFAGGLAGVSEYKEPPFRGDHRLVYGGRAGLTLRLLSGATLIDSMRRYD